MHGRKILVGVFLFAATACQAQAQSIEQTLFLRRPPAYCPPTFGPLTVDPPTESGKTEPGKAGPGKQEHPPILDAQAFAQAPAAGGEGGMSFNPAMFGDLGAASYGLVTVRTFSTITTVIVVPPPSDIGAPQTITTTRIVESDSTIRVPVVGAGSFKIADNESPKPTDRVFFNYNYYDRVNLAGSTFGLNRELIGFEKTFLDRDASFGMRLPFLQTTSVSGINEFANHEVGDLTLISKFALINDWTTGNVLSVGLALTVPTADHSIILADGSALRSVLFQPYGGWILTPIGGLYLQAFHSIVIPTDNRDIIEMNNDIAIGYWVYRGQGFLRGIVPTFETHIFTPLNHTNHADIIFASDIVTLTWGINFVMPRNSTLGFAIATPVTGPRPDNIEALLSLNIRF